MCEIGKQRDQRREERKERDEREEGRRGQKRAEEGEMGSFVLMVTTGYHLVKKGTSPTHPSLSTTTSVPCEKERKETKRRRRTSERSTRG